MGKVSRNEPCHCGSGRKYKHCCLRRDEEARNAAAAEAAESARVAAAAAERSAPAFPYQEPHLRAYAQARVAEDSREMQAMRRRDPQAWASCSIEAVASLTTEQIQVRLAAMGIDASREAFVEAAGEETSAWEVSERWLESRTVQMLPPHANVFAGLAACELWKRFCPERLSLEMVDDWLREGYAHAGARREAQACDAWWRAWQGLRSLLEPKVRTLAEADQDFGGEHLIFNWAFDFTMALINASIDDRSYAEMGVAYLRELIDRFPDEGELERLNIQADLGELLFRAGRAEEGEPVLRALIEHYPDQAIGYCRLAAELEGSDPRRALALLEEARARPVEDGEDFDLELRIQDLKKSIASR